MLLPRSDDAALRAIVALAVVAQLFCVFASFGVLNAWTIAASMIVALPILRLPKQFPWWTLLFVPLAILASRPPRAFDETLYHLPYIRAVAESGTIALRDDIRFGVFPMLHELLCVPVYLAFGATATHFVAFVELLLLAALLGETKGDDERPPAGRHGRRRLLSPESLFVRDATGSLRGQISAAGRAGPPEAPSSLPSLLAAAIVLGNPAMLLMGSITYVDAALVLFVAAGFFCIREDRPLLAGFLLGSATGVKYLGWFFVAAALLYVGRRAPRYLIGVAIGAAPMLLRILVLTGNPLHPYFIGDSPWRGIGQEHVDAMTRVIRFARLLYDITFAREHVNFQPPYTPMFVVALIIAVFCAKQWRLGAICLAYLVAFVTVMPADSRYLLPLVPLVSVPAAQWLASRISTGTLRIATIVIIAPLVAYPIYALTQHRRDIPGLRALQHKGAGRVVVCGGEELKYFGGDELVGDHKGPYAYDTLFRDDLRNVDAPWILVSKRNCRDEWKRAIAANAQQVYEDEDALLFKR